MQRKIITIQKILWLLLILTAFYVADFATAAAWWGKGAKPTEWVLAHGGTVVYYKIIASGANDRYKAIMYREGKFVEVENSKTGKFDDPKDGVYVIKAVRGGVQKNKTRSGGKAILSATLVARPGEVVNVVLDTINDKASVSYSGRAVAVTPPVKQETVPKPEPKKTDVKEQPAKPGPAETVPQPAQQLPSVNENPIAPTDQSQAQAVEQSQVEIAEQPIAVEQTVLSFPSRFDCAVCSEISGGNDINTPLFPMIP